MKQCTGNYDSTVVGNFVRDGSRMSIFPERGTSFCFIINGGLRFRDGEISPDWAKFVELGDIYMWAFDPPQNGLNHMSKDLYSEIYSKLHVVNEKSYFF